MIDVIAQSGSLSADCYWLIKFRCRRLEAILISREQGARSMERELRGIDRFTGKIVDQQLEAVYE